MMKKLAFLPTLLFLMPVIAFANEEEEREPGEMGMNSQMISHTADDAHLQESIGFEVAPFLFLEANTQASTERTQELERVINTASDLAFVTNPENVNLGVDTEEIVASLFQSQRSESHLTQQTSSHVFYADLPMWAVITIGVVVCGLVAYLGILIGKKVQHLIHAKKQPKEAV